MVKKFFVGLSVSGIILAAGGNAAADTTTVNVSANITGTCKFDTTPSLAFGALDQTSAADATASGALTFWCTKNSAYTLTDPDAAVAAYAGTISNGAGGSIPYSIAYNNDTGSGGGKTAPITSTLDATIANADYVDAPAGNYTGTVVFTIAP